MSAIHRAPKDQTDATTGRRSRLRTVTGRSVLVAALALTGLFVLGTPAASAAVALTVTTTADIAAGSGDCGNSSTTVPSPLSLREATCIATNYGSSQAVTINIPTGHYTLSNGELTPGKGTGSNVSLVGAGSASTIIDGGNNSRVLDLDSTLTGGVTNSISNLTVTGGNDSTFGGAGIIGGSNLNTTADALSLNNVIVTGNHANTADMTETSKPGGGVQFLGGQLTITNSTISNNTSGSSYGSGLAYGANGDAAPEGLTITNSTFSGNATSNTKGDPGTSDGGALALFGTTGSNFSVTGSRFVNNSATSNAGSGPAVGGAIWQKSGNLTVTESTFTGNSVSGGTQPDTGGAIEVTSGTAALHYNRFAGNIAPAASAVHANGAAIDATDNWFGCNAGPGSAGCDTVGANSVNGGTVGVGPRLFLTASASPATVVGPNGTSTLSAAFTTDSLGAAVSGSNLDAFDALPATFSDPPGDATVTLTAGSHTAAFGTGAGHADIDYHSGTVTGPDPVNVTFDNQTVTVTPTVNQPPAITSANSAHFNTGQLGSFTVTTTGYPTPAITEVGTLPTGLTFSDNGDGTATISGTATGPGGTFPLNLTANNGINPNATQTLTLTVGQPPAFTSGSTATFRVGMPASFTVTTSGTPAVSAITESGTLPPNVSFTDNGDGTATISGSPNGPGNTYPVTLTATNGVAPNATQNLTIQVNQAPAITLNPSNQTVQPGQSVSFTASASGTPSPTVQWQRSTNGGASFTNIPGATSTTYTFTAASGDNGNQYQAVFSNGVGSSTSTSAATLNVGTAPVFTSADNTSFVVGQAGSFAITTNGVPSATLSRTGAQFPAWLTLTDNGDGTGTLTGTPPAGAGGQYQFTLKAANGFSPSASQTFTLFVDQAPVISSADHATFTAGNAGSFAVTTTAGFPTTTAITKTGSLPSGVTLVDNGDGTATLAGNPTAGTGGSYPITITATASGGSAPPATQSFTLTVLAPPAITSSDHTTFSVGHAGSFTVTTSAGDPASTTITKSGTLPSGVSFTDNGDGTATLAGTPDAGAGGSYTFGITASNGVSQDATQTYTLTVQEPTQITSADHATFTLGGAGSFTVTTAGGFPTPAVLFQSGALPSGMTFTDNGDGTATLAGTPTQSGSYPITITANNGVAPNATQSFTLTVNQSPSITSADHATFAVGSAGSFTVTTMPGTPSGTTLDETGSLPSGVTFVDNGDGTATLAGTPDAGSGGSYPITITAGNGVLPDATQSFTLTVTELPAITSANHTSFPVAAADSFTVTTTAGYPAATTLTEAGALPSAVTFTDNGDGTATLAGTPQAGTAGDYPLTMTATNSAGHTEQTFTLTVGKVAQTITVTSMPPTAAQVGESYTPTATSDSGLPVYFGIDAATTGGACTLAAGVVHFVHSGSCVLDAQQDGDGTYAATSQVQPAITVTMVSTNVALTLTPATAVYGQPVTATATISAGAASPAGTVQFTVGGTDLGAPVTVAGGQATSPALVDTSGNPLEPGAHTIGAEFTPTDAVTYATSSNSVTDQVSQGDATTTVAVHANTVTANVSAKSPAVGTPTGTVTFSVGGNAVGSAALVDGTATLDYTVAAGMTQSVGAAYGGSTEFAASSDSTARHDPRITATLHSWSGRTHFLWFRSGVYVSFHCTTDGAALTHPCPSTVTLNHNGAGQSVSRTITATDGGMATVSVTGINIDLTKPTVRVTGIRNGAVYAGKAPTAHCVGHDALSGLYTCTFTRRTSGGVTHYRATATDRAGNKRSITGSYRVNKISIQGAALKNGAYQVHIGRTYTLVVIGSASRPRYYDAAAYNRAPTRRDNAFRAGGRQRWVLGVTMTRSLRAHKYWNLGVKIGRTMHKVKIHIV